MGGRAGGRALLTVLFTDIAESTRVASEIGDGEWRRLLDEHDAMVRAELKAQRGREINNTGDGFLAVFDTPGQAIRFAQRIVERAHDLHLRVRTGLHTGEVERRGKDIAGIGVHIASRIADLAEADEIVVSATIKDLVAGTEFRFLPRGSHALRGVPGKRRLFSVGEAAGPPTRQQPAPPRRRKTGGASKRSRTVPIRVLLVDDHPLWRQTLRGLLDHSGVARVTAEAADGHDAVEAVAKHKPDVVVMDIDLPRITGIEATRQITSRHPDVKVLMLSSLKERDEVVSAVQAGACGYLLKTADAAEITNALSRIHAGELVFPAELSTVVLGELRNPRRDARSRRSGLAALTRRENEVLRLMAEGRSNESIRTALHLSVKTVEAHISSVFVKLGLQESSDHHRRVQAVVKYLSEGET